MLNYAQSYAHFVKIEMIINAEIKKILKLESLLRSYEARCQISCLNLSHLT